MPTKRKYEKGVAVPDISELVRLIAHDCYVIEGDRRMHPSWMASRQLFDLMRSVKAGRIFYALPVGEKE